VRIYTLIEDIKNLDPASRSIFATRSWSAFRASISGGMEKETVASRGFFVSSASYDAKQKQLQHILEVEVPFKLEGDRPGARLGDLRKTRIQGARRSRSSQYLGRQAQGRARARPDRPSKDVNADRNSLRHAVNLLNKDSGVKEEFVILDPWESGSNKRIISYLSPLGGPSLFDHTVGEGAEFRH